jgi:hypothetical protein
MIRIDELEIILPSNDEACFKMNAVVRYTTKACNEYVFARVSRYVAFDQDPLHGKAFTVYITRRDNIFGVFTLDPWDRLPLMFLFDAYVPVVTILDRGYFDGQKEEQTPRPSTVEAAKGEVA